MSQKLYDELNDKVSGYEHDSRLIKPGQLFFALKGTQADGHDFLKQVAMHKAYGAVVNKNYQSLDFGLQLFYVEDPLKAMHKMAHQKMKSLDTKVIAVTGSVGKTTSKEYIAHLLKSSYKIFWSPGNYNSQIMIPITLLNAPADKEYFVLEYGMGDMQDIENLVRVAPPHAALLTKITYAHISHFPKGLEGIAKEKTKIFSHPRTKIKVFNYDILNIRPELKGITYSLFNKSADYYYDLDKKVFFEYQKKIQGLDLPSLPSHFLENAIGSIAMARQFQIDWATIQHNILSLPQMENRFFKKQIAGIELIEDYYNANIESMSAALDNIPNPKKKGRKIALLGEMLELGQYSSSCHEKVFQKALKSVDHLFLLGSVWQPYHLPENAHLFFDKKMLVQNLKTFLQPDDILLVKASRGIQMEDVVSELFGG